MMKLTLSFCIFGADILVKLQTKLDTEPGVQLVQLGHVPVIHALAPARFAWRVDNWLHDRRLTGHLQLRRVHHLDIKHY